MVTHVCNIKNVNTENNKCIVLSGRIHGREMRMLVDTGAEKNFVTRKFIIERQLMSKLTSHEREQLLVRFGNGIEQRLPSVTFTPMVHCGKWKGRVTLNVLDSDIDYDVILGMPWLKAAKVKIDA